MLYTGRLARHNYALICTSCGRKEFAYYLFADRQTRERMIDQKFEKQKHPCPSCITRYGYIFGDTMKVLGRISAEESNKWLNLLDHEQAPLDHRRLREEIARQKKEDVVADELGMRSEELLERLNHPTKTVGIFKKNKLYTKIK